MAQTKGEKLQSSMINSLIIHFLTASACFLLCTYPYAFSSMHHLAPIFLPRIYSLFSNPKFLFFVVIVIVAFLVKESNMLEPPTSNPTNDMYDEYIKRSQRTRRVSSLHVHEKMDENHKRIETTRVEVSEKKSPKKCCGKKQRVDSKGDDSEEKGIEEVKEKVHCRSNLGKKKEKGDEEEEEEEEYGLSADELNKRADAFIARVNRQRLSETKWLVCSKA